MSTENHCTESLRQDSKQIDLLVFRLKLWFASNYDTGQIHTGFRLVKPKYILMCDIGLVEFAHQ